MKAVTSVSREQLVHCKKELAEVTLEDGEFPRIRDLQKKTVLST